MRDGEVTPQIEPIERTLLRRLYGDAALIIHRKSARRFDLSLSGTNENGVRFSAWLPLAAIRDMVRWHIGAVAAMTDYPEMAKAGDWSAVRDSSEEKIWNIFQVLVAAKL